MSEPTAPLPELTPTTPRSPLIAWLRRFARLWGFGLFILFVLVVFRAVALPFVLGVAVAYVLSPVVATLSSPQAGRWHLPPGIALIVVYRGLLTAVCVLFTLCPP